MEGDEGLTPSSNKQEIAARFSDWADSMCSYYMAMGVSYHDYWYGDYTALPFYAEAHQLKNAQKNQEMWLQGLYVHDAFAVVLNNAFKKKGETAAEYPKEPYPLTQSEAEARKERDMKNKLAVAKAQFEVWAEGLKIPQEGGRADGDND